MARNADGIQFVADAAAGRGHAIAVTSLFQSRYLRRPPLAGFLFARARRATDANASLSMNEIR
jgi:hypothetical protein